MPKRRSKPIRLTLPWECMVPDNRRFLSKGHVLTPRYRKAMELCALHVIQQVKPPRPRYPKGSLCSVELTYYVPDRRRRDVGNTLKIICDSLEGPNGIWEDDYSISHLCYTRAGVDRENPRCEIVVRDYTDE